MKIAQLALLSLALSAVTIVFAESYSQKETFSQTAPFDPDGKVSLHNVNGNIRVEAWDKDEILVEGEKSAKTEDELKRIDLKINVTPSRASITVTLPRKSGFFSNTIQAAVDFRIKIPRRAAIDDLKTVNSNVDVTGVSGPLHVETVNGEIHAQHLAADTDLQTVNGGIHATFDTLSSGQSISLKSVNGTIEAALPSDAGVKLSSTVVNGTATSDFLVDGQRSSKGKRLAGTIGDGRASLDASSVNGSVRLQKL